jgi:hypothetical protein
MRGYRTVGLSVAAMLAVSGCQEKQQAVSGADATAVGAPAATGAPAGPAVVTVHARDFSYDAPDQIPAGMTTFHLVNDGPGLHHLVVVRLDSGKAMSDLQTALKNPGPFPRWATLIGGPNAADPHAESVGTLDIAPGNYVLICFVETSGGPHFAKGMLRPLTVTAARGPTGPAPTADVTLTLSNYKFDLSQPLTAGPHTIKVEAAAGQPHEVVIVRLDPGKTLDDLMKWVPTMVGAPPGHAVGGASPAAAGYPTYITLTLVPATYVFICFLPDAADGKPHAMHGMVQTIDVT